MTKQEAIEALEKGAKISHDNFSHDEYIYLKNGMIHDENDYNLDSEFWKWRQGECWNDGYFEFRY